MKPKEEIKVLRCNSDGPARVEARGGGSKEGRGGVLSKDRGGVLSTGQRLFMRAAGVLE